MELLPPFFQIGLAMPYNQIVVGGRYILYGSSVQQQFPRCVGVLCAWAGGCLIGAYRLFVRRRTVNIIKTKAKRALGMEVAPVHSNPMYPGDHFDEKTKPSPRSQSGRSGSGGGSDGSPGGGAVAGVVGDAKEGHVEEGQGLEAGQGVEGSGEEPAGVVNKSLKYNFFLNSDEATGAGAGTDAGLGTGTGSGKGASAGTDRLN